MYSKNNNNNNNDNPLFKLASSLEKLADAIEKDATYEKTASVEPQISYGTIGENSRSALDNLTAFCLE